MKVDYKKMDLKDLRFIIEKLEEIMVISQNVLVNVENIRNNTSDKTILENAGVIYMRTDNNMKSVKEVLDMLELDYDVEKIENKEIVEVEQLRRITGYLVGDYKKSFNNAKKAELKDRVKHI